MTIFLIEPDINGLMCALFKSFTEKIYPYRVHSAYAFIQAEINADMVRIETDKAQAERVKKALLKYGGDNTVYQLRVCLMSYERDAFTHAICYAHKMLNERRNVSEDLCDVFVSNFFYTLQKVQNERHRMHGFLRFSETVKGVLYAPYTPDNDITELIAPHFLERLPGIPFVIHDLNRNRIAISDGYRLKFGYTSLKPNVRLSQKEQAFSDLWKRYFNTVNIPERKNLRQQNNYMPKRYRAHMPETWENYP
jgi:probable DNA metabolism protein